MRCVKLSRNCSETTRQVTFERGCIIVKDNYLSKAVASEVFTGDLGVILNDVRAAEVDSDRFRPASVCRGARARGR